MVNEEAAIARFFDGNKQEAVGEMADPQQSLRTRCSGRVLQGRLLDSAPPQEVIKQG